ncbi:MAG: hypothetical protein JXX14_20535 [Deltaproteobacteria bacterium]|nr:hypothetical protein [Deltaproteobacteria bacterium]
MTLFTKTKITILITVLIQLCITANAFAQCTTNSNCGEGQTCVDESCQAALAGPVALGDEVTADNDTAPADAVVKKERIKPLWLGGLITFSAVYVATIVGNAVLSDEDARGEAVGYALIPMAGPFISLGNQSDDTEVKSQFKGIMVVSGILQILGVGAFTAGMIIKREPKNAASLHSPKWWLTPAPMGRSGAGAVFTMTHF